MHLVERMLYFESLINGCSPFEGAQKRRHTLLSFTPRRPNVSLGNKIVPSTRSGISNTLNGRGIRAPRQSARTVGFATAAAPHKE